MIVFVLLLLAAADAPTGPALPESGPAVQLLLHPDRLPWTVDPKEAMKRLRAVGASECDVDDPVLLRLGEANVTAVTKGATLRCSFNDAKWRTLYRWTAQKPAQAAMQDHGIVFPSKAACKDAERRLQSAPFTSAPDSGPSYRAMTFTSEGRAWVLLVNPRCDVREMILTGWPAHRP